MLDELCEAIEVYKIKWDKLVASTENKAFFGDLQPSSAAWKVTDAEEFNQKFNELRDVCDQIHMGWINERWLATLHLKDSTLPWDLSLIKLMQRRPGSDDAVGLDHLDFHYQPSDKTAKEVASHEAFRWSEESNGKHCKWISVWFDNTEAKIRSETVLDVCALELKDLENELLTRN